MKKLFTLFAFLAVVLGAKAEWVLDKEINFSSYTGFPHYVMGYVPEFIDGVMTDFGSNYKYLEIKDGVIMDGENAYVPAEGETNVGTVKTQAGVEYAKIQLPSPGWHQYFAITGVPTEIDGSYRVTAYVKASEACNVSAQFRWSWSEDPINTSANIGTEWAEVEWNFSGVAGTACDFIVQPGGTTATIEWQWIKVEHNAKPQAPKDWIELLEGAEAPVQYINKTLEDFVRIGALTGDDVSKANYELVKKAEADAEGVYTVPSLACSKEDFTAAGHDGEQAWANQLFIVSPTEIKAGDIIKVSFDYKAKEAANTNTQAHGLPTYYHHWQCVGDVAFTTEWQSFSKEVTVDAAWAGEDGMYSVAFNLNPENCNENDFYIKNVSLAKLKLEEGYFIAGANKSLGIDYDCANAIEFEATDEESTIVATVGEKGAYVNEIMISTKRGDDAAFKTATLKLSNGAVPVDDPDEWFDYEAAGLAKISLPSAGIWKIKLDIEYNAMSFEMVEGDAPKEPIEITPNPTEVVVKGQERDWLSANDKGEAREKDENGEDRIGKGEGWDNQFFIVANRELEAGEVTVLKFKYKSSVAAKTTTQCHGAPGAYIHWAAIGDVNFTTEEQTFEKTLTIPNECAGKGMKSIAFNMAEIKGACDYEIKEVEWYLQDMTESLIDMEGSKNFFVKEGAGTAPYQFGTETGIANVVKNTKAANGAFNLAGQRVANGYKGIVIENGVKVIK